MTKPHAHEHAAVPHAVVAATLEELQARLVDEEAAGRLSHSMAKFVRERVWTKAQAEAARLKAL